MNPQQSVYPKAQSRSLFNGNGEPSTAYPYPDPRSNPAVSGLRGPRGSHEPVHHGGVKAKRTPKRFAPMHSSLHRPDIDIVTVQSPLPKSSYVSTDEQLSVRAPFTMPQVSNKHRFPSAASAVATAATVGPASAIGAHGGYASRPHDAHAHPRMHTAAYAPKPQPSQSGRPQSQSHLQPQPQPPPQTMPTERRTAFIDLTDASDSDGSAPSRLRRDPPRNHGLAKAAPMPAPTPPLKAHVHLASSVLPMIVNSSHTPPSSVSVAGGPATTTNRGTSHHLGNGSSNVHASSFDQYRFPQKSGSSWVKGDVAPNREPSVAARQSLPESAKLGVPALSRAPMTNIPVATPLVETPTKGVQHPVVPVRIATPPQSTEAAAPLNKSEAQPPPATMTKVLAGARLPQETETEMRPSVEVWSNSMTPDLARVLENAKEDVAPSRKASSRGTQTDPRPPREIEEKKNDVLDRPNITPLVVKHDSATHRSALLDAQIYSQEGARTPPPGVSLDCQDTGLLKGVYTPVYLHTNPRIHGMHHRSEAWAQQKAEEIRRRGYRKRWFGKPVRRRKWLQARKVEMEAREAQRHKSSPYPVRKEPEPWSHQAPADFASMREEDLPSDVRDNPVWLRICARLAEDKAMRQAAVQKTLAAHKRDAEARRREEADALARAREQNKEAARRQAQSELSRQLEEVRKLASPRAKPPMTSRVP